MRPFSSALHGEASPVDRRPRPRRAPRKTESAGRTLQRQDPRSERRAAPLRSRSALDVDDDGRAGGCVGDEVALEGLAVDDELQRLALAAVLDVDAVLGAAALAGHRELGDLAADAGAHAQ